MNNLRLWRIENGVPYRSKMTSIPVEKNLEDWIEADASLVHDGLTIVGRQVSVEGRKNIIDLLAIDSNGRWCIIEIKRQKVDDKTIGQAMRYATWIKKVPREQLQRAADNYLQNTVHGSLAQLCKQKRWNQIELFTKREFVIYLVGTQQADGLDEVSQFLRSHGIVTKVITLQLFQDDRERQTLVREVHETQDENLASLDIEIETLIPEIDSLHENISEPTLPIPNKGQKISPESLCSIAESQGVGREFKTIFDAATKHGLYPRTYKHSIMYTPPQNKTRVLICTWVYPSPNYPDCLSVFINPDAFAEFFPISQPKVIRYLGKKGQYVMALPRIEVLSQGLDKLFAEINNTR